MSSQESPSLASQLQAFKLLGGYNAEELWPCLNVCMVAWAVLAVAPRWKYTPMISMIPPILTAIIYAGGIFSLILFPEGEAAAMDFFSLEGVVNGFKDPNGVFIGWVHYVVFDTLVGRMITFDSVKRGATTLQHVVLVVPCLFFTMMLGPTGWLAYTILSHIFLMPVGADGETKSKTKSKRK